MSKGHILFDGVSVNANEFVGKFSRAYSRASRQLPFGIEPTVQARLVDQFGKEITLTPACVSWDDDTATVYIGLCSNR